METVDAQIQRAVTGWQIPMLAIPAIGKALKEASERGEDIEEVAPSVLIENGAVKL